MSHPLLEAFWMMLGFRNRGLTELAGLRADGTLDEEGFQQAGWQILA